MGLRSWLILCVVFALALVACSSPGKSFAVKDLKITAGPSPTPAQPVIGQATTLSFTVRNTWNQPLSGVAWELRETGSATTLLSGGATTIPAFGSSSQSFVLSPTKGTHTYEVVVDPTNAISEENEANNTGSTLTLLVADQEIAFGTPAPAITPPSPTTSDPMTLTFVIANTVNAAQTSPAPSIDVPFTITLNGGPVAFTATPVSPASVPANGTAAIAVALPATGSAGTFVYTITLTPADGDDRTTSNNSATVTVVIPASI